MNGCDATSGEPNLTADALVIGAGPAGIGAANELARRALDVVVVDENQRPGGQIDRMRFESSVSDPELLAAEVLEPGVTYLGQTVCHGFTDDRRVLVSTGERGATVGAGEVIIATGSNEVVYPIPGWTLPGVMTAGAAQTLLKGSATLPHRRVVVAGSGPLLLAVACQLLDHGVDVAAVVDGSRPRLSQWREGARLLAAPAILGQGARYLARLAKAGVRPRSGHGVRSVEGTTSVEGAWIAPLDRDWNFTADVAELIDCDAVLLCHGFTSVTELVAQAGGRLVWDDRRQDWIPERDTAFRTTAPGVRAVGDCAGVAGSQVARAEGSLAGILTADALQGRADATSTAGKLRRDLARLDRFRAGMDGLFRTGPGVGTWARADTHVCRCERVRRDAVDNAIAGGAADLHGLKLSTRVGMGSCQARTCSAGLCALLEQSGVPRSAVPAPSQRFPVRPVPIDALASNATVQQRQENE